MRKKRIVTILLSSLTIITLAMVIFTNNSNAIDIELDKQINKMVEQIEYLAKNNSIVAMSSNPYDYIRENEGYDNIVKLGYEALPIIQERIENSENNGLIEYILALASEDISGTDLKTALDGEYTYSTAKQWSQKWNKFVLDIEDNIEKIKKEDDDIVRRNIKLKELGIVAIPYLVEEYNAGDNTLEGIICELVGNLSKLSNGNNVRQSDIKGLIKEKKNVINDIKEKIVYKNKN